MIWQNMTCKNIYVAAHILPFAFISLAFSFFLLLCHEANDVCVRQKNTIVQDIQRLDVAAIQQIVAQFKK